MTNLEEICKATGVRYDAQDIEGTRRRLSEYFGSEQRIDSAGGRDRVVRMDSGGGDGEIDPDLLEVAGRLGVEPRADDTSSSLALSVLARIGHNVNGPKSAGSSETFAQQSETYLVARAVADGQNALKRADARDTAAPSRFATPTMDADFERARTEKLKARQDMIDRNQGWSRGSASDVDAARRDGFEPEREPQTREEARAQMIRRNQGWG